MTGTYEIYNKVSIKAKTNQEAKNLEVIKIGIKSLYGANSNYSSPTAILNTIVNQARITHENMRDVASISNIVNSFGESVTITPINLGLG